MEPLELHRTVIDGVPVLWAQGPPPLTAWLSFGCGARDETFRTIGVTHMVEHLAMSTLPRLHHDHNASVDLETTTFEVAGRAEQVVAFLDRVCTALADLPVDRAAHEAGVLRAEDGMAAHPTALALLTRRFGTAGPGLEMWVGPGPGGITAQAVLDHAARFFHRSNAVLTLTGPPPDGLRLPLPQGDRPAPRAYAPRPQDGPRWSFETVPGPGLSFTTAREDAAAQLAVGVLVERLTRSLRHGHAITYQVDRVDTEVDADRVERSVVLDARDGHVERAARLLWDEAVALARSGPDPDELDHELEGLREVMGHPQFFVHELDRQAHALLHGRRLREPADVLAAHEQVTPQDVAAAIGAALGTAWLVLPDGEELDLTAPDGTRVARGGCGASTGETVPAGKVLRPGLFARAVTRDARRARLVVAEDAIAFVDSDGDAHVVPDSAVVGVEVHDDGWVLYGRDGCVIPVLTDLWPGAAGAVRMLEPRFPESLRFPDPHPDHDQG